MRKCSFNGNESQRATNKTMTVSSNFKFQNLERLNTIVGEVSQRNNKEISIRAGKVDMSGKVLDLIKNRIKTNCDKLYENYDDNKKIILKQIQQVETNMLSENAISKGLEHVIKEKSNYDKARADLEAKQRKLKKLNEVRDQLKGVSSQNRSFSELLTDKCSLLQSLESYKQTLDYQTSILNNMKAQRRSIKLFLKQKYDKMLADEQFKKQRIKKLENINHNKRANLVRIQEALKKEEHCEIPQNLAGELQRKLQQYQGKHIYQNIIKHETIISEQMRRKYQQDEARQREQMKKIKAQKQKQEKKEYELAYNFYLIKQQQQQKIKKICGVSSLSEIVNNSLQTDLQNLELIKSQTQSAINQIRQQNQLMKKQISELLTGVKQYTQDDLLKVQQQYVNAQKQIKALQSHSEKKYNLLNQWHALIQMITQKEVKKDNITQTLKQMLDFLANRDNTTQKTNFSVKDFENSCKEQQMTRKFKKLKQQFESQCSILDASIL